MVNFRVVENPEPSYVEKYSLFVDLYNNMDISVVDIRKKLGWSTKVYTMARNKALAEGKIVDRKTSMAILNSSGRKKAEPVLPKNYSFDKGSGKYLVKKRIYDEGKGCMVSGYFGLYDNEEEAQLMVEELKKVGWNKDRLDEIKKRVLG